MDTLSALAERARFGDERALELFVEGGYDDVWRLCSNLVDYRAADDLAQETFVRAVASFKSFRGASSARTWLLAIARHVCADELRALSRRRRRDASLAVRPPQLAADPGGEVALTDLVGYLDLDRRAAFVLTQLLGLSYNEAAQVCDCPVGTVRSRVACARAQLLELLSDHRGDDGLNQARANQARANQARANQARAG